MKIVVTEKPSVARDIARVLGASQRREGFIEGTGIRITWCVGHLLELQDPAHYDAAWKSWRLEVLPIVPERFALRVRKGAEDQFRVVRSLLTDPDVDTVVNACDAGREGELIFRYVYQHAGCRKPVSRFWVSSMTDEAIGKGWKRLSTGSQYDALAQAARCRSEADWLVGMNMTRAMTCRTRQEGGDALWSIGRVQTPTLAMIAARDAEIEAFVPEDYWTVKAKFSSGEGTWAGSWFRQVSDEDSTGSDKKGGDAPRAQRLMSAEAAEKIVEATQQRTGEVQSLKRREKIERSPLLYDLTALQRRANKRYGLSAQKTLEIAQALYERHKLITYPRTDARYLTSDQVGEIPGILRAVGTLSVYADYTTELLAAPLATGSRVVRDAEVGDHHAIIPTDRAPTPGALSADEKRVYDLVARRLLAVLSPDAVFDLTDLVVAVPPAPHVELPEDITAPLLFRSKGRVCRQAGWRRIDPPSRRKDVELPALEEGAPAKVDEVSAQEEQTKPPRPHDDASILKAMETAGRQLDQKDLARAMRHAGLGTPATRAAILQTLLNRKYLRRDKRALRATESGRALIAAIPVEELKSPVMTGRWEKRLAEVAEGHHPRSQFMADVVSHVQRVVDAIRGAALPEAALVRTRPLSDALGSCPHCDTPVRARGPVFTCDTGRACPFVVFSTMSGRKISTRMVKELLSKGKTKQVKGFKSRAGKEFTAGLVVKEDGRVGFWFVDERSDEGTSPARERGGARSVASSGPATRRDDSQSPPPVGASCPACGHGKVLAGRRAFGCSRWREGCGWRMPFEEAGRGL